MKFYPMSLVLLVDKTIGMTSKSVHVSVTFRDTTITHYDGYLMQRFRKQRPEIPVVIGTSQVGFWVTFNGMIQIREFHWVTEEKHRSVIPHQIPNTFIDIEFQGKSSDISFCIGCTSFACNGRKSGKHFCFFSDLTKNIRFSIFRYIVSNCKSSESSRAFCMHSSFRNHFSN